MQSNRKRTWCGKTPGQTVAAYSIVTDEPTCRNCQSGELRHNDNIKALKEAAERDGYVYDETTGIASPNPNCKPKVTVTIKEDETEGFALAAQLGQSVEESQ
jgi:hypothetical protein